MSVGPSHPAALTARACALVGLGAAGLAATRSDPGYAPFDDPVTGGLVLITTGAALATVGLVALERLRRDVTGPLLLVVAVMWFASVWNSPGALVLAGPLADVAFTAGLVAAVAASAPVVHLALTYPGSRRPAGPARAVVLAGYVVLVGVAGVGGAIFLDPAGNGCTCPGNLLLVADLPALAPSVARAGLVLGLAWCVVAAVALVVSFARGSPARRRLGWGVTASALAYLALVAISFTAALEVGYLGTTPLDRLLWLGQAGALLALCAAVAWGLLRARRVRAVLAGAVVRPGSGTGLHLRDEIADLVGDPDLVIAYRVDDGGVVDARGRPVNLAPLPGRRVTEVPLSGGPALLVHRPGALDSPVLVAELASAAQLAFTNDRLRARSLNQITQLRTSQRRIVQSGDDERRRLERDLHDGAQQRLVGVLLALRLLRGTAGLDQAQLLAAEDEVGRVVDDLRDLSRGLFPVVLRDEGLAAALHALAETHRLDVGPLPDERLPEWAETTAYLLVARAAAAGPATVEAAIVGARLVVSLAVDAAVRPNVDLADLVDRAEALGGSLTLAQGPAKAARLLLDLPLDGS